MNWTQALARRGVSVQSQVLAALVVLGLAIIAGVILDPTAVPFTSLMVPLLLGSILLGPRRLPFFVLFVMILLFVALSQQAAPTGADVRRCRHPGPDGPDRAAGVGPPVAAGRRRRGGGVDVRRPARADQPPDRSRPPARRAGTPSRRSSRPAARRSPATSSVATRPTPAAARDRARGRLGQGRGRGRPCPALAGAFGGLLGALPSAAFLPAANEYLLRQDWDEGFATAIHLSVDLRHGRLRGALGGPPARAPCARPAPAAGRHCRPRAPSSD